MKTVSIILPTYNRLERLRQVIASLEQQTYPLDGVEVIVVSDGSTDGTHEYLHALATPLHLAAVTQPNSGPAVARNTGVAHASGDIIVFLDDDVVPTRHWLAEHMQIHERHADAVVLGPMLTPLGFAMQPWTRWEQAMLMKQYVQMTEGVWEPTARQFYTGNTSLARRYVLDVGGFDATFRRAEDVELAYRLVAHNLTFIFNAEAVGLHYAERSFSSWMDTPYAYGQNDIRFVRDKDHTWILPEVQKEFRTRHPLIRLVTNICTDRRVLHNGALRLLKVAAQFTERCGWERMTNRAYSALFNLRYYQGVADEIGGWQHFLRLNTSIQPDAISQRDRPEACSAYTVEL